MTNREFLIKYADFGKEAAEPYRKHVIQPGDNYHKLGKRYNVTAGSIAGINPGLNPRRLQLGSTINIPQAIPKEPTLVPAQQRGNTTTPSVPKPTDVRPANPVKSPAFSADEYRFYDAISSAETGSFKNPWIRTTYAPPEGSTAFGPVQITRGKALDYFDKFPDLMNQHRDFYDKKLGRLHTLFAKFGRRPDLPGYDKSYDYGGVGEKFTDDEKLAYKNMMLSLFRADDRKARKLWPKATPDQRLMKRIELWRGVPYSADPNYYNKVLRRYKQR